MHFRKKNLSTGEGKKTHKAEEIINCTDIFLRVKEMEETSCSTSSSPLAFGISSSTPSVPERE